MTRPNRSRHGFHSAKPIRSFTGHFACFNNSFPCDVRYGQKRFRSVEQAYRVCSLDKDLFKIELMRDLLRDKFVIHQELGFALCRTYGRFLIYENKVGDTFWGVMNHSGENRLGLLLMEQRERLWKVQSNRELCGLENQHDRRTSEDDLLLY